MHLLLSYVVLVFASYIAIGFMFAIFSWSFSTEPSKIDFITLLFMWPRIFFLSNG